MTGLSVTVDIATKFIGSTEDVYIIRPGENFSLYNDIIRNKAVFLDFPDIRLQLDKPAPSIKRLREDVMRSAAIRGWHRAKRTGTEPPRDPSEWVGEAFARRVGTHVAAIKRLYWTLPAGTIVAVPGPGYFSDVMIGELVGDATEIRNVSLYPGETLPARRIRWVGRKPKAAFPEAVRERLRKPTPLMALDRTLREEILKAAYSQYSIGKTYSARITTTESDFSTLDDYNIQTFVNYISGVIAGVETGHSDGTIDLKEALEVLFEHRELILELTSNINSPGNLRFYSQRIAPLIVAVMLAIATATTVPVGAQITALHVTNSAVSGDDPCALEVESHALEAIKAMDLDTWKSVCVRARDAAKSTGLSTEIKVIETKRDDDGNN